MIHTPRMKALICSAFAAFLPIGTGFGQMEDYSTDQRTKVLLAKFATEQDRSKFSSGSAEEVYLKAVAELLESGRILRKIVVFLNVAPPIPEGYQVNEFLFSGMDPSSISDEKIRKDYVDQIARNRANHILQNRIREIHEHLIELASSKIGGMPETSRAAARRLLDSVVELRFEH